MAAPERSAYGGLLTVQVLFGLFPVAAVEVFKHVSPLNLLAVRVTGAAVGLYILHALLSRNRVPVRKEFPLLALLSLLGVVLNMGLFLVGLSLSNPLDAVLVITTIPVFTYALAVLLKREELGSRRALGIALALAGAAYLVWNSYQAEDTTHRALGNFLILANAICFAGYLVLAKPLLDRYDPLSVTTWMFVLGAVVALPLGLLTGMTYELGTLTASGAAWLLFIVLGPSMLTYLLNARALRHVPASTVAAFTYVQPVVTALAAWLVLGRPVDASLLPAAALVFAGLWLVARRKPAILEGQVVGE